jgi:hypothetical protein
MHMLMCIVLSAIVMALYRAIRVVCLHDVSMIAIGVESAYGGREERQDDARGTRDVPTS